MRPDKIEDEEILYRAVRKSNPGMLDDDGRPTAALFMDSNGASVDRDGGRSESTIISEFVRRFGRRQDYDRAVKISAKKCRDIGTYPNPVGNKKNIYHAEIHESETEVMISLGKALMLAKYCEIV